MASNFPPSRKPDFELAALVKGTKIQGPIGAGWMKEDGNIHIKFNHFADLNVCRDEDVLVTLFDRRNKEST